MGPSDDESLSAGEPLRSTLSSLTEGKEVGSLDGDFVRRSSSIPYSEYLAEAPRTKRSPDILRVVSPNRLLAGFGRAFDKVESSAKKGLTKKGNASAYISSEGGNELGPAKAQQTVEDSGEHAVSDAIFYSARQAMQIDAFVSHVWSAPRWKKTLALLYYLNFQLATIVATLVWIVSAVLCVVVLGGGDVTAFGGKDLVPHLVWVPMFAFFAVFFFGHLIPRSYNDQGWWLDKLCIHQTRLDVQEKGLMALPEFVATSKRVIILWSDTYFERLWCNAEVATFAAVNSGADRIDFLPLWLAPWILGTIAYDVVSITICNRLFRWITDIGVWMDEAKVDPGLAKFLTPLLGIGLAMGTAYLPMIVMNLASLRHKIEDQKLMISHIDHFRLQNAKCSVESDRQFIESHVGKLFLTEADAELDWDVLTEETKSEALESFNSFVRGKFKRSICRRMGEVARVPYHLALIAFIPLAFASLANVFGCDGMECEFAAKIEGYSSASVFMMTNGFSWLVGIVLIYPTTYPVMLAGLQFCAKRFASTPLKLTASAVVIVLSYYYMGFLEGLAAAIIVNAVTGGTAAWYFALVVFLVLLVALNYHLFGSDFGADEKPKSQLAALTDEPVNWLTDSSEDDGRDDYSV